MTESITIAALTLLAGMGLALTYFAYELSRPLLSFAGTAGGLAGGFVLGVGVAPAVFGGSASSGGILFLTATLVLFFGLLGYILVPALGRLAFSIAGFVATALATLVVVSEGRVLDALFDAVPATVGEANPIEVFERFVESPAFEESTVQQAFLLAVVLGFVGAALAMAYYDVVAMLAITGIGAAVLAGVVPLLSDGLGGDLDLAAEVTSLSPVWFALFFVTGIGFQLVRYRNELDVDIDLLNLESDGPS